MHAALLAGLLVLWEERALRMVTVRAERLLNAPQNDEVRNPDINENAAASLQRAGDVLQLQQAGK